MDFTARGRRRWRRRCSNRRACCSLSKSASRPNGLGNSSGVVGHYFCEHVMGPGASGMHAARSARPPTNDDGRPQGTYIVRFRNVDGQASRLHPRLRLPGRERRRRISRRTPTTTPGFGAAFKKQVRDRLSGAASASAAFGEVLARRENRVLLDPDGEGRVGHPGAALRLSLRRQREEDGEDMAETAEEMLKAAGAEDIDVAPRHPDRGLVHPRDRAPRAWATIRRRR